MADTGENKMTDTRTAFGRSISTKRIAAGHYEVTTAHGLYTVCHENRHGYFGKVWFMVWPDGSETHHETKGEAVDDIAYATREVI